MCDQLSLIQNDYVQGEELSMGHFGFSYIGLIYMLMIQIPIGTFLGVLPIGAAAFAAILERVTDVNNA